MPAEAGIQLVVDHDNFKDLDSRFRGNDGISPIMKQSLEGEGGGDPQNFSQEIDFSIKVLLGGL